MSRDILLTSLIISGPPNWRSAPLSLHYAQDQGYSTEKVPVIHAIIISPTFKTGTKATAGHCNLVVKEDTQRNLFKGHNKLQIQCFVPDKLLGKQDWC